MATLSRMRGVGPGSGFWIVAVVFVVTMAYSTVPTPLYPLYEQRDDFPVSLVTVIYSAFAVGVMLSLYLFGHVSDWLGRRRCCVIAVGISIVSAVMFLLWPETAGLIAARAVNGVSIGILSATATAHLGELRAIARPQESPVFATSVAGAANLGGLALGSLIGGLLAELLPDPLVLPHVLFLVLLVFGGRSPCSSCPRRSCGPRPFPGTGRRSSRCRGRDARSSSWRPSARSPASRSSDCSARWSRPSSRATFGERDHLLAGVTVFAIFGASAAGQLALVVARGCARS